MKGDIDKINFLIIVNVIDTNILDDISKTLKESKYRLDLLTLSIEDLKSSTDETNCIYRVDEVQNLLLRSLSLLQLV